MARLCPRENYSAVGSLNDTPARKRSVASAGRAQLRQRKRRRIPHSVAIPQSAENRVHYPRDTSFFSNEMKLACILAPVLLATAAAAQNAATPAPTTPCPVIPGWEKTTPSPTPASSTPCPVIPGWEKCTEVSVEGDATYCIDGPVCSGSGAAPTGDKCPKKGDVAKKDCLQNLKSYTDAGKCVAPMGAQCVKIKTGAWGCVFSAIPTTPAPTTPCPVIPGWEKNTPAPTPASTTPCPVIPGWEKPTPTPCPVIPGWEKATPAPSVAAAPVATPAPTTAAPIATPVSTTAAPVATPVSTTAAPVATPAATTTPPVVAATTQSFAATETTSKDSSNNLPIIGAFAGIAAAVAIAGVVAYKKRAYAPLVSGSSPSSPTIYNGAVNTPV